MHSPCDIHSHLCAKTLSSNQPPMGVFLTSSVRSCGQQHRTGSPPSSGVESAVTSFSRTATPPAQLGHTFVSLLPLVTSSFLIKASTSWRGASRPQTRPGFTQPPCPLHKQALKRRTHGPLGRAVQSVCMTCRPVPRPPSPRRSRSPHTPTQPPFPRGSGWRPSSVR